MIYWISRGDGAVVLFFCWRFRIVIAVPTGTGAILPAFIIRRVCRIYLPYLAGISLSILGNVSYAMYLNHISVIYFVLSLCWPVLPLWPLCLVVVATTLLVSFPFWRYIERPSIALGRRLVQRTESKG